MPQPPYVRPTLRVDGGSLQTGALTVSGNNAIELRLENSIALKDVRWEVYGYPEGYATPAGWTLEAESRKLISTDLEPADLPIPDTATLWGKWLIDVYGNSNSISERGVTGVQTLSPGSGLSATAPGEEDQFGGYGLAVEGNWRLLDGGGGGGGGGPLAGDVTGPPGSNTVTKLRGKTVATSVASPTLGQLFAYTSAGEYGLTPFPSAKGQILYWHQGNGTWALTAAPTSGQVLTSSGDTPTWAAPSVVAAVSGDLSGTLPSPTVAKIQGVPVLAGVPTNGHVLTYSTANTRWEAAAVPAPTFTQVQTALGAATGPIDLNSQQIRSVANPSNPQDVATKSYVDGVASGLDVKASVRAATTANVTLSGTQTIDGVSLVAGDRVLVKDQTTGSQNGLYVVAAGAWSRATDADTSAEVTSGLFTFVTEGTVNGDSGWVLTTNDPIVLGTTALSFAQFSGAGQVTAGAGLVKTGNTLDVAVNADGGLIVTADELQLGALGFARVKAALALANALVDFNGQRVSHGDGTFASNGATVGQVPGLGNALDIPLTSGSQSLLSAGWAYSLVTFSGALPADTTVTLQTSPGRRTLFVNLTTGTYLLKVVGSGGGATYLLPGQARWLSTDLNGILRGEGLRDLVYEVDVAMSGKAGGTAISLCALPPLCTVDLFEALEAAAITWSGGSGGLTLNAGIVLGPVSGAYDDLLTSSALGTSGTLHGWDKTKLGTAMATNGYGWVPAGGLLRLHPIGSTTGAGGTLRVLLRARWLG